jgi:hypothetical protein
MSSSRERLQANDYWDCQECGIDVRGLDERIAALEAQVAERDELLRRAHYVMLDWHLAYGSPDILMSDEERAMGETCRAIDEVVDLGSITREDDTK